MNFKDYQATRVYSHDLSEALPTAGFDSKKVGYIYANTDFIGFYNSSGGNLVYSVLLGNMEHLTTNIEEAEKVLWANHHVGEAEMLIEGDDLDYFVQGYCALRRYTVDGDLFGVLFSWDEHYHPGRAAEIIEEAAKNYGLWNSDKRR